MVQSIYFYSFTGEFVLKNIEEKFKKWTGGDMIEGMGKDYVFIGFKGGYETAKLEYEERLKESEKALKFYCDPGHWGIDTPGKTTSIDPCDQEHYDDEYSNYGIRGGKRAREYFKKWSEGK